jgi:hypothetical protein
MRDQQSIAWRALQYSVGSTGSAKGGRNRRGHANFLEIRQHVVTPI